VTMTIMATAAVADNGITTRDYNNISTEEA
jgi:hypothetical protein